VATWTLLSVLCLSGFSGCPPKPMPGTVLEIDQHIDRLVKGVPYTPHADGYWLSDDAFDGLMQQLEDLQYRLDSMPKTNVNRTPRQNLSASMGQSTDSPLSGFNNE